VLLLKEQGQEKEDRGARGNPRFISQSDIGTAASVASRATGSLRLHVLEVSRAKQKKGELRLTLRLPTRLPVQIVKMRFSIYILNIPEGIEFLFVHFPYSNCNALIYETILILSSSKKAKQKREIQEN